MKKLNISLIFMLLMVSNVTFADSMCPDNDEVFITNSDGYLIFEMPSGAIGDPDDPYTAPAKFNEWSISNKFTPKNITSYVNVKYRGPYALPNGLMGATCDYGAYYSLSNGTTGSLYVAIVYCAGSPCK